MVIGLLYGNGDFSKTLDRTTPCGLDADCNPSTAGGILGVLLGYKHIPVYWKMGLKEAEDIDFKYTTMSLNKVYEIGYKHALLNIEKKGGRINGDNLMISVQQPNAVRFEKSFAGCYPVDKITANLPENKDEINFSFEGTGFVVKGETVDLKDRSTSYVYSTQLYIDGKLVESPRLPASFIKRRYDICCK